MTIISPKFQIKKLLFLQLFSNLKKKTSSDSYFIKSSKNIFYLDFITVFMFDFLDIHQTLDWTIKSDNHNTSTNKNCNKPYKLS